MRTVRSQKRENILARRNFKLGLPKGAKKDRLNRELKLRKLKNKLRKLCFEGYTKIQKNKFQTGCKKLQTYVSGRAGWHFNIYNLKKKFFSKV